MIQKHNGALILSLANSCERRADRTPNTKPRLGSYGLFANPWQILAEAVAHAQDRHRAPGASGLAGGGWNVMGRLW